MAILIVGEKPSVSRAISSVVGANATKKGYTPTLPLVFSINEIEFFEIAVNSAIFY